MKTITEDEIKKVADYGVTIGDSEIGQKMKMTPVPKPTSLPATTKATLREGLVAVLPPMKIGIFPSQ